MNRDNILIFVAGVVVGGAAGYFYGKSKERSAAEKDIQEAKEYYKQVYENEHSEKEDLPVGEPEQKAYREAVRASYITDEDEEVEDEEGPVEMSDVPYVIDSDAYVTGGSKGFGQYVLRYYTKNGVLVNEQDETVDIESNIGSDFINHFGEFETNTVFVRNEAQLADYEVLYEEGAWPINEELS